MRQNRFASQEEMISDEMIYEKLDRRPEVGAKFWTDLILKYKKHKWATISLRAFSHRNSQWAMGSSAFWGVNALAG